MTLGSLFDGAGGFPLAGKMAGFTPLWASEIEPFPIRVTTKRFPNMRHLGNITEISGKDIEPVDVITFGSPCQDLSVAGKRAGLDGERSGLFMEAIRIIKEMREETNGKSPTFIVWENVPGAFSSNKGEDFRTVLEEIAKIADGNVTIPRPDKGKWLNAGEILGDGYSIAWRVLDAQFWGVPQRRKRIYLVADFADRRAGRILFERESVSRNTSESGETRERVAETVKSGSGTAGTICLNDQGGQSIDVSYDVTGTLRAQIHGHSPCVMESAAGMSCAGFCTEQSAEAYSIGYEEEKEPTLRSTQIPDIIQSIGVDAYNSTTSGDKSVTLTANSGSSATHSESTVMQAELLDMTHANDVIRECGEVSPTLQARMGTGGNQIPLAFETKVYGICSQNSNSMKSPNPHSGIYEAETTRTLDLNDGNPSCNQGGMVVVEPIGAVCHNIPCVNSSGNGISGTLDAHYYLGCGARSGKEREFVITPNILNNKLYVWIVRRLTPLECCRLQGYPDLWAQNLDTAEPTEEDLAFWTDVFEAHRKATDPAKKPKTKSQIKKWLQDPQTDSAEYKMWGNSLAIPCAYTVLAGIAEELTESKVTK